MRSGLELWVQPDERSIAPREAVGPRPAILWGMCLLCALVISAVVACLPVTSTLLVAGAGMSCLALAALPGSRGTSPEPALHTLTPGEVRDTYCAILAVRAEIGRELARAPGLATAVPMRQQCDAAIRVCGRVARVADRLQMYLATHDPSHITREIARLRARAEAALDDHAARSFEQAVAARERQLATCTQLAAICDRLQAGLDLVLACMVAYAAVIVKAQAIEAEHVALAGDSLSDHVADMSDELEELAGGMASGSMG